MGFLGWWKRRTDDRGTRAWREAWTTAVAACDASAIPALEAELRRDPPIADDLEIEEEMLDGLRQLIALERDLAAGAPPAIETSHRVVGSDRCHFSAPVAMPDDPAQPTGRLLLTSSRAVFAGGARTPVLPWHGVQDVLQSGRDLLFVGHRAGSNGEGLRFRCNSFADALCGAAIARYCLRQTRGR